MTRGNGDAGRRHHRAAAVRPGAIHGRDLLALLHPCDPDPNAVLQRLRQGVFATGQYSKHDELGIESSRRCGDAFATGSEEGLTDRERGLLRDLHKAIERAPAPLRRVMKWSISHKLGGAASRSGQTPQTIDELLELAAEEAILDIETVSTRREVGAAAPVPEKTLRRFFGTTQPTRRQAEQSALDLADMLDRWQAFSFVADKDGRPDEYAFVGCSGD